VSTDCNRLQQATTRCNTLQHNAAHCSTLQHTATPLQHTASHCITLQHTATHCITLHHTATHCNTLHHTATHCVTLQHSITWKTPPAKPSPSTTRCSSGSRCTLCLLSLACAPVPDVCPEASPLLQCVVAICRKLQWVAVCCSMLQHSMNESAAYHACSEVSPLLQCVAVSCSVLQYFAECCRVLQFAAQRSSSVRKPCCWAHNTCKSHRLWMGHIRWRLVPDPVAVCCRVLQCVAVCCSVLQWNILRRDWISAKVSAFECVMSESVLLHTQLQCVAVCCSVLQCIAVGIYCGKTGILQERLCCIPYGVATMSRLLKIIGLFCKRAL